MSRPRHRPLLSRGGGPAPFTRGETAKLVPRAVDDRGLPPELFKSSLASLPTIVWIAGPDGSIEFVNRRCSEFLGFSPGCTLAGSWIELLHPEDADRARCDWDGARRGEVALDVEWRIRRADAEYRWMSVRAAPVFERGLIRRWVGTCSDLEDQKRLETHLRSSERVAAESLTLLETLQSTAPVGFGFVDLDFCCVRINETLAAMTGATVHEMLSRPVPEVVPALWSQIEPLYHRVLDTGRAVVNHPMVGETAASPGEMRHWLASCHPVQIADETIGIGIVVVDVTDRHQAEEFRSVVVDNMAEGLFTLDAKGGLMSMNAAATSMLGWTEAELHGQPVHAVIHFQHADGSPLPEEECELLKVRIQARTVRMANEAFTRKDGSIFSVAYSAAPLVTGRKVEGLVIVFRDVTEERTENSRAYRESAALTWMRRIREAIDHDHLLLYSQPILPLTGGDTSEELLLRMSGPRGEIIPPGGFLPIAEKCGLIGEIDHWVVNRAIRLAASGRRLKVNLSAESISTMDLLPQIERELGRTGCDPANIVFEITETAMMRDIDAGQAFALRLVDMGCSIALDDFGTGFGSFTYLKRLPISHIKIDIEFVRDLVSNPANQHVVKAIVSLARAFGCQTIAEGVEDAETLAVVSEYGVDYAQGFLIGRPKPVLSDCLVQFPSM